MKIGKRLKELLKTKGMTQTRLAELTGFRQSDISSWINDLHEPRPESLARIADALGVPVANIVNELPKELSDIDYQLFSLSQTDKKLALDFLAFLRSRRPKIGD